MKTFKLIATPKRWRGYLLAVAAGLAGAALGLSLAPLSAAAAPINFDTWKCGSYDSCEAGTKACCSMAGGHCSTNCPIIVH